MIDEISRLYAEDDLSQLSRVTLVIPTYNRNFYLSRCLWYHAHFPFAEIIVADSSPQEKRDINKKTIQELSVIYPTKITYLEYDFPAEEYGGEIYRKWGDAVHHITTEYALSCTDKEFLIPTTVVESIKFLDEHPDYSLADGKYYKMNSKKNIVQWQGAESVTATTASERFNILTKCIIGTQFALHRTEEYIQIFENLNRYELYDIRFGEILIETFPFLNGKLNRNHDAVMSIRDCIEYYKQNNIINIITNNLERKKAESSFCRYRIYASYPLKRRMQLLNKYKECIGNNSNIDKNSSFFNEIIIRRFPPNLLRMILYLCWNLMPYKLKYTISPFIPKMIAKIISVDPINEPVMVNYIFKIIQETSKFIPTDTPITQTSIFQGEIR